MEQELSLVAWLVAFLTENAVALGGAAALLAIIETVFSPFRAIARWLRKPERILIANPEAIAGTPLAPPPNTMQMDVATFTALQSKLRDEARVDLAKAHGEERKRLEDKIDALNQRLANPEEALAQQHAIILDLEAQLTRRGNDIGGDRLAEAKAALEAGNFTAARALFEDLQGRTAPDVQANAAAAFALGQIAETEIRWQDAAEHYGRAARLNPTFDTFHKAREFAWRSGDYPAALRLGENMLTLARSGSSMSQLSLALNEHALTLKDLGRHPEAEGLYRQALDIYRATIGEAHPDYAACLSNFAIVVKEQGRYTEAEGLYRKSLEIDRATIGESHPTYAAHLSNLADVVRAQGRYTEAEALCNQALDIGRKTLGVAHPDYATRLNNLAVIVEAQGRYHEAEGLYRQALEIGRATLGEAHPAYAGRLNNLASVLGAQRRYTESEVLFRQSLLIARTTVGEAHPAYATHLNNLAGVIRAQGRYLEAEEIYRQALKIDRATIGEAHPHFATDLNNLAGVVKAQGRHPEAEALYKQCLAILRDKLGDQHPNTQDGAQNYLSLLEAHNPSSPDIPGLRALLGG